MSYIANTDEDIRLMLDKIGFNSIRQLWAATGIPECNTDFTSLPDALSEYEVASELKKLSLQNSVNLVSFLGAGYYDHIIPAVVNAVTSRSEFYTAYTPYQPEASQGTLQAIYEYQTAICRLTGMEVANASMYDGGTALFEAMMMAVRITGRRKAVISAAVSPIYREIIKCYSKNLDIELLEIPAGLLDSNQQGLADAAGDDTACILVQYPNVFGTVEEWSETVELIHKKKTLAVCSVYPQALSLLKTPADMGFDIVTGEGQSLGLPLNFGGPYLGFMAAEKRLMRKMPGRIAGRTTDKNGKEAFVLTLQAREQHIRRAKAMSNICSNENLCALAAVVYLTGLGKSGMVRIGELCASKATFAKEQILQIDGVEEVGKDIPFFNEFVISLPMDASEFVGKMINKGYAAGFPLGKYYKDRTNQLLIAVTEKRTKEEIKGLANSMEAILK